MAQDTVIRKFFCDFAGRATDLALLI